MRSEITLLLPRTISRWIQIRTFPLESVEVRSRRNTRNYKNSIAWWIAASDSRAGPSIEEGTTLVYGSANSALRNEVNSINVSPMVPRYPKNPFHFHNVVFSFHNHKESAFTRASSRHVLSVKETSSFSLFLEQYWKNTRLSCCRFLAHSIVVNNHSDFASFCLASL